MNLTQHPVINTKLLYINACYYVLRVPYYAHRLPSLLKIEIIFDEFQGQLSLFSDFST